MTHPLPLVIDPSRRAFCSQGCLSAAALALAGLSSACGGGSDTPTSPTGPGGAGIAGTALPSAAATVTGRTVSVPIDGSPLAVVGGAAILRTSVGNFLLARTGGDSFTALTAVCTHEGNTVTNFTGSQFVCPVHGSQFNVSGTVAQGPATRPLTTYPTQVANGVVSFTA